MCFFNVDGILGMMACVRLPPENGWWPSRNFLTLPDHRAYDSCLRTTDRIGAVSIGNGMLNRTSPIFVVELHCSPGTPASGRPEGLRKIGHHASLRLPPD